MASRAQDTRAAILEAAFDLTGARGSNLSMSEVARATGISRQAVHLHFPTRADLLLAMARHHDRRSGFIDRVVATRDLPPAEALEALIRAWCVYIPEIHAVARALHAEEARGSDSLTVSRDRMEDLHQAFTLAVERLAAEGRLAPGWSRREAADWAWSRCHFTAWHQLVVERGWKPKRAVDRIVATVMSELVADG